MEHQLAHLSYPHVSYGLTYIWVMKHMALRLRRGSGNIYKSCMYHVPPEEGFSDYSEESLYADRS